MAEGSPKREMPPKPRYPLPVEVNERTIGALEDQAMDCANKAISALEEAIETYDAAKEKPDEYSSGIRTFRSLHQALSDWMTAMLRNRRANAGFDERVRMLERFADIWLANQGM